MLEGRHPLTAGLPQILLCTDGEVQVGENRLTKGAALFVDPEDGTTTLLTPERSIAVQRAIGSDVMMVMDQCIPSTSPHAIARAAMERTHRWAKRSLAARTGSPPAPTRRCSTRLSTSTAAQPSC